MNADALAEWEFWETLSNEERLANTEGVPPYDVDEVAARVMAGMLWLNTTDGPILDLGCGTGRLTAHLSERLPWHEFWAVDISQRMLDHVDARQRQNVRTFLCDGRSLPETIGRVSAAYAVTLFQHIPREAQRTYIEQVATALRPWARFVFTVSPGTGSTFLQHRIPERSMLDSWCKGAGLEVLAVHHDIERDWSWVTTEKTP